MAKQIKIGFDKIPIPAGEVFEKLYDINSGLELRDADGGFLYTAEVSALSPPAGDAANSLSVYINNAQTAADAAPVEEQFPETSEVSSSLLGVPRSETQLSLFSDVSTYGMDTNNWQYYQSPLDGRQPQEWVNRYNPVYGNRYFMSFDEISNEQALAINSFPVGWSFPFGPNFQELGLYNEALFVRYQKFIELGNLLYDTYVNRGQKTFADQNFLSSNYALNTGTDVQYNEDLGTQAVFDQIELWTLAWMKIRDGNLLDLAGQKVLFPTGYDSSNTTPGYSSNWGLYSQLESTRTYRYQPGRASGFTFGIRASTDPASLENVIEWGCANTTDGYTFQIRGSQFNIVRRSTIPLLPANLERMGMKEEDQVYNSATGIYETVIPRDKFNGDTLDGNGASRYIISFEQVTMWKIEFSWYGAIGARFYVYIPVGNGEARWVRIHTLVLENELNKPVLKDPFLKFRYSMRISNTSNLTYPQYIYKYGASYYVDGGDEGTMYNYAYSSNIVDNLSPLQSTSLIGLKAKDFLQNGLGDDIKNRKDVYPTKLTVTAEKAAKISVVECDGCPGFAYHYSPSLRNGQRGLVDSFTVNELGTEIFYTDPTKRFKLSDNNKKVIAPGLFNVYLDVTEDNSDTAKIKRRLGTMSTGNNFSNTQFVIADGQKVAPKNYTFTARLTGYEDFIASTVKLSKPKIRVNFLNTYPSDTSGHYADFLIGITNKAPALQQTVEAGQVVDKLAFNGQPLDFENDLLYLEYHPATVNKTKDGYDNSEFISPSWFRIDYRLPSPRGNDSGECSYVGIDVVEQSVDCVYSTTNPVTSAGGNFLIFTSGIMSTLGNLLNGEIGKPQGGIFVASGVRFSAATVTAYREPVTLQTKYYVPISDKLDVAQIGLRIVTIGLPDEPTYDWVKPQQSKLFNFDVFPLYVVVGMRDNSRINNITIEERDDVSNFTYSPVWIKSNDCNISVIESGNLTERINPSNGLSEFGGLASPGIPPANFTSSNRLESADVDTQLQQPLRPGEIRYSVYVGDGETTEIDLTSIFGRDRYTITPGLLNTKATFVVAKAVRETGEIRVSLMTKEQ